MVFKKWMVCLENSTTLPVVPWDLKAWKSAQEKGEKWRERKVKTAMHGTWFFIFVFEGLDLAQACWFSWVSFFLEKNQQLIEHAALNYMLPLGFNGSTVYLILGYNILMDNADKTGVDSNENKRWKRIQNTLFDKRPAVSGANRRVRGEAEL